MNSGRHFNPPTPAYRPVDPFSGQAPRAAEDIPSCDVVTPPQAKPRPVRMEAHVPVEAPVAQAPRVPAPAAPAPVLPTKGKAAKPAQTATQARRERLAQHLAARVAQRKKQAEQQELRKCEWARCKNTFLTRKRNGQPIKRFCSATCRGRASESRKAK